MQRRPLLSSRLTGHVLLALLAAVQTASADEPRLPPYKPSAAAVQQSYERANALRREYESKAFKLRVQPRWFDDDRRFWYRNGLKDDTKEFVVVDPGKGTRLPAFDHERLAKALAAKLGRDVAPAKLPFDTIEFYEGGKVIKFKIGTDAYEFDLGAYEIKASTRPDPPREPGPPRTPRESTSVNSPDGKWSARINQFNVYVKPATGEELKLTEDGTEKSFYSRVEWSPDSKKLIAARTTAGDRGQVHLVESSPREGNRARLQSRTYDQPGDKLDSHDLYIIDPETKAIKVVPVGENYFGGSPRIRWSRDRTRFLYDRMDRGYQRWRVSSVDVTTGEAKAVVDDRAKTFIDSTTRYLYYCSDSDDLIFRSERDGWGHLYITDGDGKATRQITKGEWVVRGVTDIDEKSRQIIFTASGVNSGEDPYFVHFYRIGFDGKGLKELTPGRGNHSATLSPGKKYLIDTYSTVTEPPVHEVRRVSDGKLMCAFERADISELVASSWKAPEVFVSKGRDGTTDIWGVAYRPSNFDPTKTYPIIEDIYAGPQDSFVPKSFAIYNGMQALAELGFIVVKVDGMGTRNRSKAFHDVCWQNLGDHGFPDRILWIKAFAAKYMQADQSRIGIYGTSAGGQSSTAGLLFHPNFYKVAVSSCGCHDNRMDKVWWNEQWMGYPVGPHYAAQSNITNAGKLEGKLLLIVGELDRNVPPESTYRLAGELIRAQKDFELLVLPGVDHTNGGPYGERRRRDYFVRYLLGVDPPNWNETTGSSGREGGSAPRIREGAQH